MENGRLGALSFLAALLVSTPLLAKDEPRQIPLKLYHGYTIVVQGSIGKLAKLNFLIDTGAVPSVIDERVARKLHLAGTAVSLSVFNQSVEARRVVVPELQLGPLRAETLPVLVRDLSFIEDGIGVRVDAMIGMDVLDKESFTIDYEAKQLIFGGHDAFESSAMLVAGPGYVAVQMLVGGRPVHLVIDTGAKDLILFESRVGNRLNGLRRQGTKVSSNMGGEATLKKVQLPEARLGTIDLGALDALLLDSPARGNLGFDGLLGVRSLGLTRLAFDFERQTVSWR
jgi:predicted aspartyl protease